MSIYLDTAYVAKCYINEPDAPRVRGLVRGLTDLQTSALCIAELACVFQRHIREKSLNRSQASKLRQAFEEDVQNGVWILVPVSNAVLKNVEAAVRNLAPRVYLRAADAIHLVTARDAGFSEIRSNNRHLLRAARYFGLKGRTA